MSHTLQTEVTNLLNALANRQSAHIDKQRILMVLSRLTDLDLISTSFGISQALDGQYIYDLCREDCMEHDTAEISRMTGLAIGIKTALSKALSRCFEQSTQSIIEQETAPSPPMSSPLHQLPTQTNDLHDNLQPIESIIPDIEVSTDNANVRDASAAQQSSTRQGSRDENRKFFLFVKEHWPSRICTDNYIAYTCKINAVHAYLQANMPDWRAKTKDKCAKKWSAPTFIEWLRKNKQFGLVQRDIKMCLDCTGPGKFSLAMYRKSPLDNYNVSKLRQHYQLHHSTVWNRFKLGQFDFF